MKYKYKCNGIEKNLKDHQETLVEHKQYFCVVCNECSNVPVLHLLERGEVLPEGMWKNKKTGDRLYGPNIYDPEAEDE